MPIINAYCCSSCGMLFKMENKKYYIDHLKQHATVNIYYIKEKKQKEINHTFYKTFVDMNFDEALDYITSFTFAQLSNIFRTSFFIFSDKTKYKILDIPVPKSFTVEKDFISKKIHLIFHDVYFDNHFTREFIDCYISANISNSIIFNIVDNEKAITIDCYNLPESKFKKSCLKKLATMKLKV